MPDWAEIQRSDDVRCVIHSYCMRFKLKKLSENINSFGLC
jgi:hypothetical protein